MNIETANAIPISEILAKIGFEPVKKRESDYWYLSPFRREKTASFHVSVRKNKWYDFGDATGGDAVALVCRHLEYSGVQSSPKEALRWLRNMFHTGDVIRPVREIDQSQPEPKKTVLKSVKKLQHQALIHYLSGRGISQTIATAWLQEIKIQNTETGKHFFAAGIGNEEGGYEYRNLYFKGCVGKKAITFVRGTVPKPPGINIFEGLMDFLSVIAQREGEKLQDDTIVLNSLSQMKEAAAYIRGYGYQTAYTWLDNDEAGSKATEAFAEFFKSEPGLKHIPMNKQYAPHKDVNAAHMAKLGLEV